MTFRVLPPCNECSTCTDHKQASRQASTCAPSTPAHYHTSRAAPTWSSMRRTLTRLSWSAFSCAATSCSCSCSSCVKAHSLCWCCCCSAECWFCTSLCRCCSHCCRSCSSRCLQRYKGEWQQHHSRSRDAGTRQFTVGQGRPATDLLLYSCKLNSSRQVELCLIMMQFKDLTCTAT